MVYLNKEIYKGILDFVERVPEESCGFLFGKISLENICINNFIAVKNVSEEDRSKRYRISAIDYLMAENFAEDNELELLGIYHTHLDCPATPSEVDRESALPNLSYVIISLHNLLFSDLRCWRLNGSYRFEEEKIKINNI
jgi:proteasome lid subunit RPN8/RPN11